MAALTLLALIALAHFLSRTASRRDPASLLAALALATSDTGKSSNGSPISVYLRPRRKGIIVIEPDRVIGVVGDYAREYFLWVAAQLRVQGLAPTLVAACDASGSAATTPRLIWAKTVEELGAHPSLILRSYPIAGTLWCDEVAALLAISSEAVLPNHVSFEELYGEPEMVSIKNRWNNAPDQSLKLGRTADGTAFSLDLIRDGPHALVVGGTGSGKSEFLTTLVFALAATYPPNRLRLLLIDYKGGAGLLSSASLPHVERLLTDLDGSQTPWLLRILTAEIRRRKSLLLRAGFRSIAQWNGTPGCQSSPPPLLVVVADEVRALADRSPELLKQLTDIATQGRSLGIHLIAATQRPGGTVSSDLRAVLDVRVALRCSEVSDSVDVVGSREA
ncbi:MAG: FtsK/SpoIIIE domain-containing protein, partial [Scrofimicrobium sp.]